MPLTRRHLLQQLALGSLAMASGIASATATAKTALPALAASSDPLRRIIAINWAAAETLLTLGVSPLAISDGGYYSRRMPTAALPPQVLDVGPYWEPNLELIKELQPQLILSDQMPPSIERALKGIAPTEVVDIYPAPGSVWTSATDFMTRLAARLELQPQAAAWIAAGNARFEELRGQLAQRPQPPVCVAVLNQDGRHATVYGKRSMIQDVLDRLGLVNAWQGPSSTMGIALIGIERLAENPDAHLLYTEIPTTSARLQSLRQVNALWENLPAVRRGNTLELNKFFPYGGAAATLNLAEWIAAYLNGRGENEHV